MNEVSDLFVSVTVTPAELDSDLAQFYLDMQQVQRQQAVGQETSRLID